MKKGELIALGAGVLVIVVLFVGIKVFGNLNSPEEEKPPPVAERKPNPANYTYKKKPYRAPVPVFKKLDAISSNEVETRPGRAVHHGP